MPGKNHDYPERRNYPDLINYMIGDDQKLKLKQNQEQWQKQRQEQREKTEHTFDIILNVLEKIDASKDTNKEYIKRLINNSMSAHIFHILLNATCFPSEKMKKLTELYSTN